MKKIIILFALTTVLIGCGPSKADWIKWDRLGITFEYPKYMVAAENEVMDSGDIHVKKQSVDDLIGCADAWFSDMASVSSSSSFNPYQVAAERREEHEKALTSLKKEGLNVDTYDTIMMMDAMTCGFAGGNRDMEPITLSGSNGVKIYKSFGQDCCNINSYKTELMFVDAYNDVYTILFDYDFGDLEKYSTTDYFGTYSFLPDSNEGTAINDFFINGDPIEIEWLKAFEENKEIIEAIIKTVEITN